MIREGRVRLNGKVVSELGTRADAAKDRITVDGRPVLPVEPRYFAYHKPVGVVSTMSDPEGRPSIGDVIRAGRQQLFPVGRLDFESSGLVLLTNDGDLAQRLTHPRYGVPKVYRVKVRGRPGERALARLARGVRLDDGKTQPADVLVEAELDRKTRLVITLHEGRHRQIRRMCETVGYPVDRLSRVSIGPLKLGRLPAGHIRELDLAEIEALLQIVNRPIATKAPAPGGVRWTSSARQNNLRATSHKRQKRQA